MTDRDSASSVARSPDAAHILLVFGLISALSLVYLIVQEPAQFFNSLDWDGLQYYGMAEQFGSGQHIAAQGPEVYRIGSPFIASLMPIDDLITAFLYWELASAILATTLLYVWLRLHLETIFFPLFFTILAVCTLWSPIRTVIFHRVVIEGSSFLLIMLAFFGIYLYQRSHNRRWVVVVGIITAMGATVREACLLPALMVPFLGNPLTAWTVSELLRPWISLPKLARTFLARDRLILLFPLACGIAVVIAIRLSVDVSDRFSYLDIVAWGFSDIGPLRYFAAIFNAFGPLPLVVFFAPGYSARFLMERQGFIAVLILFFFMSWSAHGDERYFDWVMPIVFVLIGRALERHIDVVGKWSFLAVLVVFEIIAVRALFPVVDPAQTMSQRPIYEEAFARYLPDGWHYMEMHAYTADTKTALTIVGVNLIMGWVLWLLMRQRVVGAPEKVG